MSTRKDQLLRRAAGNERSRAVAITREEKALRAFLESAGGADWNAAEGEPGHVANRTHYEGIEEIILYEGNASNNDDHLFDTWDIYIEAGEKFVVVFDGIKYELDSFKDEDTGYVTLGAASESFNEYPFRIYNYYDEPWVLAAQFADDNNHVIRIAILENVVHKLDTKYLPDNVATTEQMTNAISQATDKAIRYHGCIGHSSIALKDIPESAGYSKNIKLLYKNFSDKTWGNTDNVVANNYKKCNEGDTVSVSLVALDTNGNSSSNVEQVILTKLGANLVGHVNLRCSNRSVLLSMVGSLYNLGSPNYLYFELYLIYDSAST
jgi:hypothetical protein